MDLNIVDAITTLLMLNVQPLRFRLMLASGSILHLQKSL